MPVDNSDFAGRVFNSDGEPVGSCWLAAPKVVITALHVVSDALGISPEELSARGPGDTVSVQPLTGVTELLGCRVEGLDLVLDVAVLSLLPAVVIWASPPLLLPSDSVRADSAVFMRGYAEWQDPLKPTPTRESRIRGSWIGEKVQEDSDLTCFGIVSAPSAQPGMSGAAVVREVDGAVVGMVTSRYNADDGWGQGTVWVTPIESVIQVANRAGIALYMTRAPAPASSTLRALAWAQWVDPAWDPLSDEPLPLMEELGVRLDTLVALDEGPVRLVLVDSPEDDLSGSLTDATWRLTAAGPRRRRWHRLAGFDPSRGYFNESDVRSHLCEVPDDGPIGVVVDFAVNPTQQLTMICPQVAAAFLRLSRLVPHYGLILRIWAKTWNQSVRAGAFVAREIGTGGPSVGCLARLQASSNSTNKLAGTQKKTIKATCDALYTSLCSDGVGPTWQYSGISQKVGVLSVPPLVEQLNRGKRPQMGEERFLSLIRDLLPELWDPLVSQIAVRRTWPGWACGLHVTSESASDFARFIRGALTRTDDLLVDAAKRSPGIGTDVVDRLVLELNSAGATTALSMWLPQAHTCVAQLVQPGSLGVGGTIGPATWVALSRKGHLKDLKDTVPDPASFTFWALLANHECDGELARLLQLHPWIREVWRSSGGSQPDPITAERRDVARRVFRPFETEGA